MRQPSFLDGAGHHEDNWSCKNVVSMSEAYVCVTHSYCPWWELAEMGVVELEVVELGTVERGSMPSQSCYYVHHSVYGIGMTHSGIII